MGPPPSDITKLFSALDSALSLHYSSSISPCKIHHLCSRASSLANKRIDASTIEWILAIFPTAYKIVTYGTATYDYGVGVTDSISKFNSQITSRKKQFEDLLHSISDEVEPIALRNVAVHESPKKISAHRSPLPSPTKVSKHKTVEGLRNDRSKFTFKEKISSVETSKANGLSLLERIKLKERQNSETDKNMITESRESIQITSKLPLVYDIIFELALGKSSQDATRSIKSFEFKKIVSIVNDSLSHPMSEWQITQAIIALETRLGNTKLQSIQRGDTKALRIFHLDREEDLPRLA